jgi:hypothetical protein
MPKTLSVKLGDCIASVCRENGIADYARVYGDGANAALKAKRPNPNALAEGDEVVVPDPTPKSISVATGKVHRFTIATVKITLKISVVDQAGAGVGGLKYELAVGKVTQKGTTGGDGLIEHPISAADRAGTLRLWRKDDAGIDGYLIPLEIGSLEHESVDRACQARLLNLGFDCGGVTGTIDAPTHDALRGFQKKAGIPVNGRLDTSTRDKLRAAHEGA